MIAFPCGLRELSEVKKVTRIESSDEYFISASESMKSCMRHFMPTKRKHGNDVMISVLTIDPGINNSNLD